MDRVEEIGVAIDNLTPEDYHRLSVWLREFEQKRWDGQMDRDSASGKLDFLFDESDRETQQGQLRG